MLCYPVQLQLNTVNFKRMKWCNEEDMKKKLLTFTGLKCP